MHDRLGPLIVIFMITAVKEGTTRISFIMIQKVLSTGYDDYCRYQRDCEANSKKFVVIRNGQECSVTLKRTLSMASLCDACR